MCHNKHIRIKLFGCLLTNLNSFYYLLYVYIRFFLAEHELKDVIWLDDFYQKKHIWLTLWLPDYITQNSMRIPSHLTTYSCQFEYLSYNCTLTHWGQVTHICVGKLTITGSDNDLSPGRRYSIIRTNVGILLIGPVGTNFNENSIGIQTFPFKKMELKMSSAKCRPFCLGVNVLSIGCHTLPTGPVSIRIIDP